MEGEAKENDLRPISDRISGTIRRFLLFCLIEAIWDKHGGNLVVYYVKDIVLI